MKFSVFIKQMRKIAQLSQLEMVQHLALKDKVFSDLTLVTYNRWERGVSTPPMTKMLRFAKIFDADIYDFLIRIEFKQSKTQIKYFDEFLKHFDDMSNHFRLFSNGIFDAKFIFNHKDDSEITDQQLLQVKKQWNVFLNQKNTEDNKVNLPILKALHSCGSLSLSSCIIPGTEVSIANGIYIIQSSEKENVLTKSLENHSLKISDLSYESQKIESEKLLLLPLIMPYSPSWLRFNIYHLVKTFSNIKNINRFYLVTANKKSFSKFKNIGFNIEKTIKSQINSKITNRNSEIDTKEDINLYLLSCDFNDFISNHGVIKIIKAYDTEN